jgi:hypothetical protein
MKKPTKKKKMTEFEKEILDRFQIMLLLMDLFDKRFLDIDGFIRQILMDSEVDQGVECFAPLLKNYPKTNPLEFFDKNSEFYMKVKINPSTDGQ